MSAEFNPKTVLRIRNLPPSFAEFPLMKFFSQFGNVKKIKVGRSPKTLRSKGYAYVQFEDAGVAFEAQKATDGYLLQCSVLKVDQLEKGAEGMLKPVRYNGCKEKFLNQANIETTEESRKQWIERLQKIKNKWASIIENSGIQYIVDDIVL
ncbi:RNA recognition motif-containing protein [Spironucleus salmonicida]|uniref:RNA recognition motif-containing protein n=1 Tax=Spironucleus salmonicida TaxID=348837 RepID=V6LS87_9EUKA|nr:RNA recognition motif-containing protein [Spironucleus salmonicida]|eukprot:EST47440.1 RNA recognition motif-containing protein [Spironucleus salmonicida]